MIYVLVNSVLVPGKMAEWGENFNKGLVPLLPKLGLKMVGSFHAYTGNMNAVYSLWSYDDLAAYQKVLGAARKDKGFQSFMAENNTFLVSQTYTILEPNAWSPMK